MKTRKKLKKRKKTVKQSGYPCNQSEEVPDVYGGQDLRNRKVLSLEWKNDGVMDDNSGDDDTGEVR